MNEEGITLDNLGKNLEKPIEPKEAPSAEDILRAIDLDVEVEKNEEVELDVEETEDVVETEESEDSDSVDEEDEDSEPNVKINDAQHEHRSFKTFRARDITFMIDEMILPKRRLRSRRFPY